MLKLINRYYKIIWLKSTSIFKEQTRIPLELNIEKNLMSSKKNNNWAIPADFSPYRYEVDEGSHFPTKKTQNQSIRGQITFGIQLQTFRQSAIRENFNLKPETELNKLIPITEATIPNNTMKWKRSCIQIPSFMSKPYFSTRSKTCMHLEKFKVFSSLRRPKTHFRHPRGHQRAGALTGSINIFQSTIITVYEVEHQKTVNTKLGKQTIWFSEIIKDIYH